MITNARLRNAGLTIIRLPNLNQINYTITTRQRRSIHGTMRNGMMPTNHQDLLARVLEDIEAKLRLSCCLVEKRAYTKNIATYRCEFTRPRFTSRPRMPKTRQARLAELATA